MSTRTLLIASIMVALTLLPGCVPRRPAPAPVPPPAPAPAPPPPAPVVGWEEAPLSAGDWTYRDEGGISWAGYGLPQQPVFVIRCERSREISLVHESATGNAIIIRTSFGERRLPATSVAEGLIARLPAADPRLDDILFSRGRFAVEVEGEERLILPAWPEPARVVEDCRG